MESVADLFLRLAAVVVVFGGLLGAAWWARRQQSVSGRGLRVVSRAGLTKGSVVVMVDAGDKRLVLGASDHGVTLLTEVDQDQAEWEPTEPAPVFGGDRDPGMGLVARLQQRTLRQSPARHRTSRDDR